MGLGKLFPDRESLVSDILAGEGNTAKPFFIVYKNGLNIKKLKVSLTSMKIIKGRKQLLNREETLNFR